MTVRLRKGPRRLTQASSATRDRHLAVRRRRWAILQSGLFSATEPRAGAAVGGLALLGHARPKFTGAPGLVMAWLAGRPPKGRPASWRCGATVGGAR